MAAIAQNPCKKTTADDLPGSASMLAGVYYHDGCHFHDAQHFPNSQDPDCAWAAMDNPLNIAPHQFDAHSLDYDIFERINPYNASTPTKREREDDDPDKTQDLPVPPAKRKSCGESPAAENVCRQDVLSGESLKTFFRLTPESPQPSDDGDKPPEIPPTPPEFLLRLTPASLAHVSVSLFKETVFVHLRLYKEGKNKVYPSKNGICLTADLWPCFQIAAQMVSGYISHTVNLTAKHCVAVTHQDSSPTYTIYPTSKQPEDGVSLTQEEWTIFTENFETINASVVEFKTFADERRKVSLYYIVRAGAQVLLKSVYEHLIISCTGCSKKNKEHTCQRVSPSHDLLTYGRQHVQKIDFKQVYKYAKDMYALLPPYTFDLFKQPFKDHVFAKAAEMACDVKSWGALL